MRKIKAVMAGAILGMVLWGGVARALPNSGFCSWLRGYLNSDESDELDNDQYFGLVRYYNANC